MKTIASIVLWITLVGGLIMAIGGFVSAATDIQLGIAFTGLAGIAVSYIGLRLPGSKVVGWISALGGLLITFVGIASAATDIQLGIAASGIVLVAAGCSAIRMPKGLSDKEKVEMARSIGYVPASQEGGGRPTF